MEPFIGQIQAFGFNFAPRGWAKCDGQILSIAQNTALFSLLGTMYGGNGQTTFALPDLRGRFPLHTGQGPGLPPYIQGQVGGTENVTLLSSNMPAHTHQLFASDEGNSESPSGTFIAANGTNAFANSQNSILAPNSVGAAGGSQPFPIKNPYLCINYCIALQGIFPSRN
ncbi:tail fiber protein [Aequorivita sp. SDUM287046]|uniref:Tail fiber protein n=1 Tax=Aequorivita aurantiaca TaxID=3053356 RepID=A0ABT8DIP7_9FLAO|nr:tail fiber protein [Aequorivita aurantiaca]MDN3725261.1 tail fiber protein [Aequorivita aurantiaca]